MTETISFAPKTERADQTGRVLLISTYDLGHQPFGVASAAAWLHEAGARVSCLDLAVEELNEAEVEAADLVAFHVPMHTASRLAIPVAEQVRSLNRNADLCFYGLYAPVNERLFRDLGAVAVLGGEFEQGLVDLYRRLRDVGSPAMDSQPEPVVSLRRQAFRRPERQALPMLDRYAHLILGDEKRVVGYTEASRGCKHTCRHCPIVPVYGGKFRVVDAEVVLADVRQQVASGAQHISFGDPDFFNAPAHALGIVRKLHREFPKLTYDVIIKIEHLVRYGRHLDELRETGCLFVTSAVESVDETILERLDKRHTNADFNDVVRAFRKARLTLAPTFVAFTPWTTLSGYVELLDSIRALGLVEAVAPVQYAIRLLIPAGSILMDLPEVRDLVDEFDAGAMVFPWRHPEQAVDELQTEIMALVAEASNLDQSRAVTFGQVEAAARKAAGLGRHAASLATADVPARVPRMSEPWYCCAEPMVAI